MDGDSLMVLKKRNSQYARWDHDNNKWIVGNMEYQWVDMKNKPVSAWMNLDDALVWIQEYDNEKGE
jgi:hypothetical protein